MRLAIRDLIFSTGVIAALAGVSASQGLAADLAVRAPYAPIFTWTGLYGGVHLGYVWNDPELVASADTRLVTTPSPTIPTGVLQGSAVSPPGSINDTSGHRFVGGGQVGYNL